jgi:hypothetical protein
VLLDSILVKKLCDILKFRKMGLRYSASCLRSLRGLAPKRSHFDSDTLDTLNHLGLLKPFRGTKAGVRRQRWNTCKQGQYSWTQYSAIPDVNKHCNKISTVNHNNLIQIKTTAHQITKPSAVFCTMNCRSVASKPELVYDYLVENNVDCAALTETWLTGDDRDDAVKSQLLPPGYKFLHVPRSGSRGGGVAVVSKEQYSIKLDTPFQATSFETMSVLITVGSQAFRVVVIYRVPPSKRNKILKCKFLEEFADLVEQAATWTGRLLLVGDFNVHWDQQDDAEKKQLAELLDAFSLTQHVDGPTHSHGHTLDLVISRTEEDIVAECCVSDFISDHNAILMTMNTGRDHPPRKTVTFRNLRAIQISSLNEDVASSSLPVSVSGNVDVLVDSYNSVLEELLDKHAPLQSRSVAERTARQWMSDDILEVKRLKRKYEKLWRKSKLTVHRLEFRRYCLELKELICKTKSKFYLDKIKNCDGDQKQLFKIVDKLLGRGKSRALPEAHSHLSLAENFNDFFVTKIQKIRTDLEHLEATISPLSFDLNSQLIPSSIKLDNFAPCSTEEIGKILAISNKTTCELDPIPSTILCQLPSIVPVLTNLINTALSTGQFPSSLKSAIVKPLLKKSSLDPQIYKNFRPVSNLPFISKVLEKVIASQLMDHMKENDLLDKLQSAYKHGHSTETALLRVHNDIVNIVDQGKCAFLVLLDLSAAFDTVDHAILLSFLRDHIGLSGTVLSIFESYLVGRTQCISINNIMSNLSELAFGVPQGSVLGPIIFCTYTIPLGAILRSHNMSYHLYADDTQLYCASNAGDSLDIMTKIEACVNDIRSWMIKNKLKINDEKTEFLIISTSRSRVQHQESLKVGNTVVPSSASCRNLGVMFDKHADMTKHVSSVCRSAHFHLRNINSIRPLLNDSATAQLIHALITSRLDYCNSLLYGLPDYMILKLQRIQNIACRILCRAPRAIDVKALMADQHWLPVQRRIQFKVLLLTFKALNELAPSYICDLVKVYIPKKELRSQHEYRLDPPKTRLKTYGDRGFGAASAKEWNRLPLDIKFAPSLASFKSKLKTYLFRIHFNLNCDNET